MKLTGIAREDLEKKGFVCKNKVDLIIKDNFPIPDTYTECIGRKYIKTDKLESFFTKDVENDTTQELEKLLKESTTVIKKHRNIVSRETMLERSVIDYYIPYDIMESTKNKPTVTENYVVACSNGSWECEYELLLTCGDATRRIVINRNTVNIGMIELLSDLEYEIEEALEDDTYTDFQGIFEHDDYGECYINMFDELGEIIEVPIEDATDLLNMIVSARCIKCEFFEDED